MTYLKSILMTISFLFVSLSAHAQIATLDGNWHSPQWKYGYVLKDGMGIATSTNSPNFQVGQNIIQLTATSPNAFTGQQVYTDGKFYKVTATLLADGRMSFEGEKNVKWVMERIGAPPQASSSASQTYAQVQECDRLAASPFDPQKQTAGLSFDKINPNLAIPACKKATEDNPEVARLWFQYGRALEKANRLPDAIYAYQAAAKLNSGAAYNNIGELYRDGKGFQKDLNKAAEYFTLAANLNSIEGKNNLLALGRIGVPPQAISSASQTTASAPNATGNSPSFDCRKATTTVEKLVCNSPELSKLDVSLAEMYKEAVSKAPSIRDDQRSWNGEKNKCADVECLKTAYEDRISQLVNFIVRHDRAALRQDQASANISNESGDKSGLDFLFKQGGYWVADETRPGQSCNAVLAQEKFAQGFKRYSANQTNILTRIGGQHSAKNDPSVAARLNITIDVPTQYVVIRNSPNTKIKVITGYPNGAIIEELLELSPSNNTVVQYGVGSCSNCDQAQLRFHQNFSGPQVMSWCSGNIDGSIQTQPRANTSNNQIPDTKPAAPTVARREESLVNVNQSNCLKIKGALTGLKELAANHFKASINQINFLRTELNNGQCLIVWSHPRGICKDATYVAYQLKEGDLYAVDVVKFDYQKDSAIKQLSMMCF